MPFYEYQCEKCGVFEMLRPVAERDQPAICQQCQGSSTRKMSYQSVLIKQRKPDKAQAVADPRHQQGCPCCPPSRR